MRTENSFEDPPNYESNDRGELDITELIEYWVDHLKEHVKMWRDPTNALTSTSDPEMLQECIDLYEREIAAIESGDFGNMSIEALRARHIALRNEMDSLKTR